MVSWDNVVDVLESAENADAVIAAALTALAESDQAAGANITVEAAASALAAIVEAGTDSGDDPSAGSGSLSVTVTLVDNVGLTSFDVGLRLVYTANGDAEIDSGRLFTGNSSLTFENVPDDTAYRVEIEFGGSFNDVVCSLSNESGTLLESRSDNTLLTCDNDSASSGGTPGAMPCIVGSASSTTVPSGLAGASGDLTLTFAAAELGLSDGVV